MGRWHRYSARWCGVSHKHTSMQPLIKVRRRLGCGVAHVLGVVLKSIKFKVMSTLPSHRSPIYWRPVCAVLIPTVDLDSAQDRPAVNERLMRCDDERGLITMNFVPFAHNFASRSTIVEVGSHGRLRRVERRQ